MSKEATVFIVDISESIQNDPNKLKLTKQHIENAILQHVIDDKNTESIAVIFANCQETKNALANPETGEYEGIKVIRDLAKADFDLFQSVKAPFPPAGKADLLDAIVVAADMLMTFTEKKAFGMKKITLLSDISAMVDESGIEDITDRLKDAGIIVDVWCLSDQMASRALESLAINLGGGITFNPSIKPVVGKRVRPTATYRGNLTLGDGLLAIPVVAYVKTMPSKLITTSRLPMASSSTAPLSRSLSYRKATDDAEAAEEGPIRERKDLIKAYKYGTTLIPFTSIDEEALKFDSVKSMEIIGFVKQKQLSHALFMSNAYAVFAENEPSAQMKLDALLGGLEKKKMAIVARQVLRDGTAPKLVTLLPHREGQEGCFLMVHLPFAEDVRRFFFKTLNTEEIVPQLRPSPTQMDTMGQLVEKMSLGDDQCLPDDIPNPSLQRQLQCILHRLDNPKDVTVPSIDPRILAPLTPLPVDEEFQKTFQAAFPLREQAKKSKIDVVRFWSAANPEEGLKEAQVAASQVTATATAKGKDEVTGKPEPLRVLRKPTLLEDFDQMTTNPFFDLVASAMMQMMALIPILCREGNIQLAVDAVKRLRQVAIREDEYEKYNEFLRDLRNSRHAEAAVDDSTRELRERLRDGNITLISHNDVQECAVPFDEAVEFWD